MLDLTALLKYAAEENASDVHITVGVPPKIRVHGRLKNTTFSKMTTADTLEVFLSIVNPEQRDRFEVSGDIDVSVSIPGAGRYRVNAYKQRGSISLAFRLVDMEIPSAEAILAPDSVMRLCERQRGLVVISGPSGSGKSTLIATMIDTINQNREANVITIEDPIEYLHQHKNSIVNQREVGLDTESYIKGLMSALREDPDVVFVGDISDPRVSTQAFFAAQTGRLIFTSVYASGIIETLEAMLAVYPKEQQENARNLIASSLTAIVTRQLCEGIDGTRCPAYGVLKMNKQIRALIRRGDMDGIYNLISNSDDPEIQTMDSSLARLYDQGLITREMALSRAHDPETLATLI